MKPLLPSTLTLRPEVPHDGLGPVDVVGWAALGDVEGRGPRGQGGDSGHLVHGRRVVNADNQVGWEENEKKGGQADITEESSVQGLTNGLILCCVLEVVIGFPCVVHNMLYVVKQQR